MVDLSMAYSMSLRGSHFKLVGWYTYPSEKSDFVSWDDDSEHKRRSKPPTVIYIYIYIAYL